MLMDSDDIDIQRERKGGERERASVEREKLAWLLFLSSPLFLLPFFFLSVRRGLEAHKSRALPLSLSLFRRFRAINQVVCVDVCG